MREYRVDLLDFYRGRLSARRLIVLLRQMSAQSALVRSMNDPERAEARAQEEKLARVTQLRTTFEKRKRTYGLG